MPLERKDCDEQVQTRGNPDDNEKARIKTLMRMYMPSPHVSPPPLKPPSSLVPQPSPSSASPPPPQRSLSPTPPPPSPQPSPPAASAKTVNEDDLWQSVRVLCEQYKLTATEERYLRAVLLPIWVTRRRLAREGQSAEHIEAHRPYPGSLSIGEAREGRLLAGRHEPVLTYPSLYGLFENAVYNYTVAYPQEGTVPPLLVRTNPIPSAWGPS
jgi:hypothetical protein